MKKSESDTVKSYEELVSIASQNNLKKQVQNILKDAYEEYGGNLDVALGNLGQLKDDLRELNELAEWFAQKPQNLAEQKYRQKEKRAREKKYSSIVEKIKTFSEEIDRQHGTENTAQRNERYIRRMGELIKSGKDQRRATNSIYQEELGAGRTPPTPETIRRIYNRNKKP